MKGGHLRARIITVLMMESQTFSCFFSSLVTEAAVFYEKLSHPDFFN
jgi:hypothetical protein